MIVTVEVSVQMLTGYISPRFTISHEATFPNGY